MNTIIIVLLIGLALVLWVWIADLRARRQALKELEGWWLKRGKWK